MRVITGSAKGRKLVGVPGPGTRPITARVKGALFSVLGPGIRGSSFLDLFGGTGAVGIEALSRGASRVVFVERGRPALLAIRRNLEITGLQARAETVRGDAFRYLAALPPETAFDVIYVAPPQYKSLWAKAVLALDAKPLLVEDGRAIVQIHPKEYGPLPLQNLELVDERRYGSTLLLFYALRASDPEDANDEQDGVPCQ